MSAEGGPVDDDNPTSADMQAYEEFRVFEEFLEYAKLPVIPSTIENRSPPAPDILCRLTSGECVAFELGELSDQKFRKGGSAMMQFRELLQRLFRELPHEVRAVIQIRYTACRIDVSFTPEISLRRHEAAIGAFYRWLADQERFIGILAADRLPRNVGSVLPTVSISEPSPALWIEPAFSMRVSEPDLSVFKRKLGKTYDTTHPIELLLHLAPQQSLARTVCRYVAPECCERTLPSCVGIQPHGARVLGPATVYLPAARGVIACSCCYGRLRLAGPQCGQPSTREPRVLPSQPRVLRA